VSGSIVQINISRGGLPKRAILEADVAALGIIGDEHAHPQIHGGPRKALLLITSEGIEELIAQGFSLFYGALGENLTTRGIDRHSMREGQRYRVGQVLIELTRQREPCYQLEPYGRGIQRAVEGSLGGFYASVLQAGTIRTGDPIELLEQLV
jgi:MOSC domain-containing protein YiiM